METDRMVNAMVGTLCFSGCLGLDPTLVSAALGAVAWGAALLLR
ncbi:MAG: hypothetical protein AAF416_16260 [Pseudomonadota bacterium]